MQNLNIYEKTIVAKNIKKNRLYRVRQHFSLLIILQPKQEKSWNCWILANIPIISASCVAEDMEMSFLSQPLENWSGRM